MFYANLRGLFRPSVSKVLASFNRTVAQLEKVEAQASKDASEMTTLINDLVDEREALYVESGKANAVATKLKALLS